MAAAARRAALITLPASEISPRCHGPPLRGEPCPELGVASWNLGGLSGHHVLELTQGFAHDTVLRGIQMLLLQEVITEPGVFFDERYDWVLAYGKKEGEWRGEGILYHTSLGLHHHTTIHRHHIPTHRAQNPPSSGSPPTPCHTRCGPAVARGVGQNNAQGQSHPGHRCQRDLYGGGPQGNRHTLPEARKGLGVAPARPSAGHPDLQHSHAA